MDDLKRFVEREAFARHVGVQVVECGDGRATARLPIEAHHLNSAGTLHGGASGGLIADFRGTVYRKGAAVDVFAP